MTSSAIISECGQYRYFLERKWGIGLPFVTWIMLNPSTADAEKDDPTIRRCINFSKSWGFGGMYVVNLFAFRAAKPERLKRALHPVGPENEHNILYAACNSREIIAAWGGDGSFRNQDKIILALLKEFPINALGFTAEGHPRHPLYMKSDVIPIRWSGPGEKPPEGEREGM